MTINENTIRQDIYNLIYTYVNTNVSDPLIRGRQWIYNSFPDITKSNFAGYPIIVINRTKITGSKETLDNSYSAKNFPLEITVYATSNIMCDQLSDSLDAIINSIDSPQLTINNSNQESDDIEINSQIIHYNFHSWDIDID